MAHPANQRNNQQWIEELRGACGGDAQLRAHRELARYLHTVSYNFLLKRQPSLDALVDLDRTELSTLAEDFTQETLERLAAHEFRLLEQYRGDGRFLSWAAQIVTTQAKQELRRSYWTRRRLVPELNESGVDDQTLRRPTLALSGADSADDVIRSQTLHDVESVLQTCLDKLPQTRCIAFWQCVVENRDADSVATDMGLTRNAVYLHVYRAKRTLRKCLEKAHVGMDVLRVFENV